MLRIHDPDSPTYADSDSHRAATLAALNPGPSGPPNPLGSPPRLASPSASRPASNLGQGTMPPDEYVYEDHILRKEHPFDAGQVKQAKIRLATDEAAIVNNREIPDICVQHMLAVALLDKTVTFASAHDRARLKDPATLRERAKLL